MKGSDLRVLCVSVCWFILGCVCLAQAGGQQMPAPSVREVDVFQTDFFASRFLHAKIMSVDLSPDGTMLAVEFEARETDGRGGIWITLWQIDPPELLQSKCLEGPDREVGTNPQYGYQVRFTPGGGKLLVLTGSRFVVLTVPDLTVPAALEAKVRFEEIGKRPNISAFAEARDRAALLYRFHSGYSPSFIVKIMDLKSGNILSTWEKRGHPSGIAISSDASLVAIPVNPVVIGMRVPPAKKNVFIFEAVTGSLVQSLNTDYTAENAQFVGSNDELLTIAEHHGSPEAYQRDTVKLWSLRAGHVLKEFKYREFGVRGALDISGDGRFLAAATRWARPEDVLTDRDTIRGWTRLLVWDVTRDSPIYESGIIEGKSGFLVSKPLEIRFSADGSRLMVADERILLYSVGSGRDRPATN